MSPGGLKIFVWGENSQLHEWAMSPTGKLTYVAQSNDVASVAIANSPGGMPGGFCSLSSNNNKPGTALLWCTIPYGDANATITNGRLLCYDPDNVANGVIPVLWDSQQFGLAFVFNKFLPPIVDGGQVYVANYNGGVDVYGQDGN
jgi:outer membrane protein assembly factor BamB